MPKRLLTTLRFRLTLWNTVVVLVAALMALVAMREAMRLTIENEAQSLLREEATELELAIQQLHPDQGRIVGEFERKVLGHSQHAWFAALYDSNGQAIWQSENFDPDLANSFAPTPPENGFIVDRTDNQLIVRRMMQLPDGQTRTVMIGEPTAFIQHDVWQLTKTMLFIGTALIIVAPVGGYLLASRATRPVREIIATTRALDPTHLDSRLAIRGTGDELDQISAEINSFVDQISHYIKSQREFIANAAHELRSPLTAIQTSAEVCLSMPRSRMEYKEEIETVSEQCQFLRHLVNQLLELAESDAGLKVNRKVFDFSTLVEKSLAIFEGVAEESNVQMVTSITPGTQYDGDPDKLIQVLNNLIDNAIKHAPGNSSIEVKLENEEREIRFYISDQGPGVPDDQLSKIFDRFYQVDPSRNRDQPSGNGLGLSICKSIIELHGGQIHACNQDGRFTVTFVLPRDANSIVR